MINRSRKLQYLSSKTARLIAGVGPLAIIVLGLGLASSASQGELNSAENKAPAAKAAEAAAAATSATETPVTTTAAATKTYPPTSNQMDRDVADDFRKRRDELDLRAKALEAREAEFAAKERALDDELKKLEDIRADITRVETANTATSSEKIAKIVETMEVMSPKASAKVLADLDETLAVQSLSQVTSAKLAKILSALEPKQASRFTELLAGVSRAKRTVASIPAQAGRATAQNPEQNGGEKNERNSNQQQQLPAAASQSSREGRK